MVLRIFLHSLRQVFGNLGGALRVSGVLTLVQFALGLLVWPSMPMDQLGIENMVAQGKTPWGPVVFLVPVVAILWLWIIVGWHRFILLNEKPGLVPAFRPGRMLGYFGKSFLISLILLPLCFVVILIAVGIGAVIFGGAAAQSWAAL